MNPTKLSRPIFKPGADLFRVSVREYMKPIIVNRDGAMMIEHQRVFQAVVLKAKLLYIAAYHRVILKYVGADDDPSVVEDDVDAYYSVGPSEQIVRINCTVDFLQKSHAADLHADRVNIWTDDHDLFATLDEARAHVEKCRKEYLQ